LTDNVRVINVLCYLKTEPVRRNPTGSNRSHTILILPAVRLL